MPKAARLICGGENAALGCVGRRRAPQREVTPCRKNDLGTPVPGLSNVRRDRARLSYLHRRAPDRSATRQAPSLASSGCVEVGDADSCLPGPVCQFTAMSSPRGSTSRRNTNLIRFEQHLRQSHRATRAHRREKNGARGGTRTRTLLRKADFKSAASTIPPPGRRVFKCAARPPTRARSRRRRRPTGRQKTTCKRVSSRPPSLVAPGTWPSR